jgi:hypothetical protein
MKKAVPIKLRKAIKESIYGVIGLEDSSSSEETPNSIAKTTKGKTNWKETSEFLFDGHIQP